MKKSTSVSGDVNKLVSSLHKEKKKSLADFAGIIIESSEEWGKISDKLIDDRKKTKLRDARFD
jgi:uncharacterized protein YfeS